MIDGYIDRNRLLQHLNDWWWAVSPNTKEPLFLNGILQKTYKMEIIEECMKAVEAQPTADVVEVTYASWEECDWVEYDGQGECIHQPKEAVCCSNCRNAFKKKLLWKDNFCPNCGADMRGRKDE